MTDVAKQLARKKTPSADKPPQPAWLRQRTPMPQVEPTSDLEPLAPGSTRLLVKTQVLDITNVSFPTIWAWMRAGTFPRSRAVGGKAMWLSNEIEEWMAALPVRPLKGDDDSDAV
jgi:predicted DNA-binding transcriptional regulator AlpA